MVVVSLCPIKMSVATLALVASYGIQNQSMGLWTWQNTLHWVKTHLPEVDVILPSVRCRCDWVTVPCSWTFPGHGWKSEAAGEPTSDRSWSSLKPGNTKHTISIWIVIVSTKKMKTVPSPTILTLPWTIHTTGRYQGMEYSRGQVNKNYYSLPNGVIHNK